MNQNNTLLIEEVGQKFKTISQETVDILAECGEQYEKYTAQIQEILNAVLEDSLIKTALVGQYSAGKSTIISAITGNKGIQIDADIATDKPQDYHWNGVVLTDTPGLYTERKEHDDKTYEAIKSSDLLLYVLTSDLFDDVVLDNFLKLAYEDAFRNKMMLVVNKMSMESGQFEDLKENYYGALKTSLDPHDISEFRTVFIDAADYIEGTEDDFEELIEASNFDALINELNQFVDEKGLLGKVDTPIRLVTSEIGKALAENSGDGDKEFFMLLERIENRINKSIEKSQNSLNVIVSDLRSNIISLSNQLTSLIGEEKVDFEGEQKKIESEIKRLVEESNNKLEVMLSSERENLTEQLKEVLQSDLATSFFNTVDIGTEDLNAEKVELKDVSNLEKNFSAINDVVEKASGGILQLSAKGTGFVKSTVVSGTELHKGIYSVGKFFGYSFKPWQAVNAAKFLTNVARVVGPVLAVAGVLMEISGHVKEEQDLKKVLQAKNECSSSFVSLANKTEEQFQKQFNDYKKIAYHDVLEDISTKRQEAIVQNDQASSLHEQLRGQLNKLQVLITKLS